MCLAITNSLLFLTVAYFLYLLSWTHNHKLEMFSFVEATFLVHWHLILKGVLMDKIIIKMMSHENDYSVLNNWKKTNKKEINPICAYFCFYKINYTILQIKLKEKKKLLKFTKQPVFVVILIFLFYQIYCMLTGYFIVYHKLYF